MRPSSTKGLHLVTHSQNDTITLQKTFIFIFRQKTNFILHVFLEILQGHANFLFWVLRACLATHTHNDNANLQKLLLFLLMPRPQKKMLLFPENWLPRIFIRVATSIYFLIYFLEIFSFLLQLLFLFLYSCFFCLSVHFLKLKNIYGHVQKY